MTALAEIGSAEPRRGQGKARPSARWLAVLWLLAHAAGAADGEAGRRAGDASPRCTHADAEVAFVRGLVAFKKDQLDSATSFFERTLECTPKHGSARYWLGVTHLLRDGAPSQAEETISSSLDAKERARAHRWQMLAHLGAAQIEAGREVAAVLSLKAARKSLAKTGDLEKEDAAALHLLGRSLKELGELEAGEETIQQALALDPGLSPTAARINLPRYQGPFWPARGRFRWEGRLGFSTGLDSNPNLLDDDLVLVGPDGRRIRGAESDDVQDLGFRLALYRQNSARRELEDRALHTDCTLGLTLEGHRSFHGTFDFLDLGLGLAVAHVALGNDPAGFLAGPLGYVRVPYGGDRLSVLLQAGYLSTRLDESSYFEGALGGLSAALRESRYTETHVELFFQDLDWRRPSLEDRDRSGSVLSLDVSQSFFLRSRNRYLRLGLLAGKRTAGRAYARTFFEPHAEAVLPLSSRWSLLLAASVRRDDFDHSESNLLLPDGLPREDDTLNGRATLVWSFSPELKLLATLRHGDRDSELELPLGVAGLGYRRTRFSLGLRWFFGSVDGLKP